jgi:uncharacterized SAM-binding protein YcdF (DUF218 family)
MYELAKIAGYLLSPLTWAMVLWLGAGVCTLVGRRRAGLTLACLAFCGLWVASMPLVAVGLTGALERQYPAMAPEAAPVADAIVVLGGSVTVASPPERPTFGLTASSGRVWQAAALYRAGKAKWIVVAAGGQPEFEGEQVEAEAIAQMLGELGVPQSALVLEPQSRTTRENAANTLRLLRRLNARRVLLVTSAQHMPRAMQTFVKVWSSGGTNSPALLPYPTDKVVLPTGHISLNGVLPAVGSLQSVTSSLKEYAGMVALTMI